jgi:hypothetical protein
MSRIWLTPQVASTTYSIRLMATPKQNVQQTAALEEATEPVMLSLQTRTMKPAEGFSCTCVTVAISRITRFCMFVQTLIIERSRTAAVVIGQRIHVLMEGTRSHAEVDDRCRIHGQTTCFLSTRSAFALV